MIGLVSVRPLVLFWAKNAKLDCRERLAAAQAASSFQLGKRTVDVQTIWVDCIRDGNIIASYKFGYGNTVGPSALPAQHGLIDDAKSNLVLMGVAEPPFTGITFKVHYP